jgi:predicted anti-sigma-YlaC factor YlaD
VSDKQPFDPGTEAPLLSAYIDGELSPEDMQRVEAHLAGNEETRALVARLRGLNTITGAMQMKEAPMEAWEGFWDSIYNRSERSLGWVLLIIGLVVIGGYALWELLSTLLVTDSLPLYMKGGIFILMAGILVMLVSVVRERIHKRSRTRYKDVIR